MITVENRGIKKDDTAVIDFEGFVDGEPFQGGKGEDRILRKFRLRIEKGYPFIETAF